MKRQIVRHFSAILLVVSVCTLRAQSDVQDVGSIDRVGTTAAQFLKIGAGARAIALGGAYTAIATDITSLYWNPAGLSRIRGSGEATFNHAEWLADTQYDFAAFSLNLGGFGSVGFQVLSFRTPEEAVRTVRNPEGTGQFWDANSIALGLSYARSLTDRFSVGVTAKYIQENIFNVSSRGGAFDIGFLYDTPFENLTLGVSISNFGSRLRLTGRDLFFNEDPLGDDGSVDQVPSEYRTDNFELPLNFRFGLAWRMLNTETMKILALTDAVQPNDNSEYLNGGVEVALRDIIFLRAGYKAFLLTDSEQGATFGAGLQYNAVGTNIKIDFGWADYGRLKNVKFVSLAIRY